MVSTAWLRGLGLVLTFGCSTSERAPGTDAEPQSVTSTATGPGTHTSSSTSNSNGSAGDDATSGGAAGTANTTVVTAAGGGASSTESSASGAAGGTGGAAGGDGTGGDATSSNTSSGGSAGGSQSGLDVFGIEELYPSAPGGGLWTSEHWAAGEAYSITSRTDEHDPLGISGMRGTGTLEVTGDGELVMAGSQPRIYVYPGEAGPWRDVEVTVYYRRVADDATNWAGLVIGARSGPDGHGETPCDAHTYYSRLRHDGATDFEKELMHSPSSTRSRVDPAVVWPPTGELPFDTWIGYKFVIYNLSDSSGVRLETYRDMSEGVDGGYWELLNATQDTGGWFTSTSCSEHAPVAGESDMVVLDGGTTFIRNTGVDEARYRWFSVREIAP